MKKKIFKILLIAILMIAIIFGLTACGDSGISGKEDKENKTEVVKDREESSEELESFVDEFVDLVNDQNYDKLFKNYIDFSGFGTETIMVYAESNDESSLEFDDVYDFYEYIENHDSDDVIKKYSNIIDEIAKTTGNNSDLTADDKEDVIDELKESSERMKDNSYFSELEDMAMEITVSKVGSLNQVKGSKYLYEFSVKGKVEGTSYGETESYSGETTVYVTKSGSSYKFVMADALKEMMFDGVMIYNSANEAAKNTRIALVKSNVQIAISELQKEYNDNYGSSMDEYFTLEKLNDKLSVDGYQVCSETSKSSKVANMDKAIYNLDEFYITEKSSSGDIYKVEVTKTSGNSMNVEVEVVD